MKMRHKNSPEACLQFVLGQVRTNSELSWLPEALNDPSLKNWGRIFSYFAGKPELRELAEAVAPLFEEAFDWDDELRVLPVKSLIGFSARAKERGEPDPYDILLCNLFVQTLELTTMSEYASPFLEAWIAQAQWVRSIVSDTPNLSPFFAILPRSLPRLESLYIYHLNSVALDWLRNTELPNLEVVHFDVGQEPPLPGESRRVSTHEAFHALVEAGLNEQLFEVSINGFSEPLNQSKAFKLIPEDWPNVEVFAAPLRVCPADAVRRLPELEEYKAYDHLNEDKGRSFEGWSEVDVPVVIPFQLSREFIPHISSSVVKFAEFDKVPPKRWVLAHQDLTFPLLEEAVFEFDNCPDTTKRRVMSYFSDSRRSPELKHVQISDYDEDHYFYLIKFRDVESLHVYGSEITMSCIKRLVNPTRFPNLEKITIGAAHFIPDSPAFFHVYESRPAIRLKELHIDFYGRSEPTQLIEWLLASQNDIKAEAFSLDIETGTVKDIAKICQKLEVAELHCDQREVTPSLFSERIPSLVYIMGSAGSLEDFNAVGNSPNLPNLVVLANIS